jgi:uncharacterized protein (DUF362 family)
MNEISKVNSTNVAIIESANPNEAVSLGIEKLGGISSIIEDGDQIFIKINLRAPYGFPVNNNFESLREFITLCKNAGAKQIYIGSFPDTGVKLKVIANSLGIQSYLQNLGAELIFLDDQYNWPLRDVDIKDRRVQIPEVILNSDKLIIFNQLSVDPLFKISLSLLNSYSLVPNNYQRIEKMIRSGKDYLFLDQYKQDLISNILDIFSIKKPALVINDMIHFLEGAGPYVYKDSNLLSTGLSVMGRDAVAVDLITLKLCGIDLLSSDILLEARNRKLGITDISDITITGENIEKIKLKVKFSVYKLEDIKIKNTSIKAGRICSGCFRESYHLLNNIKSQMTKDLKYIKYQCFMVGENPPEPESLENIIVFGDCAINSTINREFRRVRISKDRNYIETIKGKVKKDSKPRKTIKVKEKSNKLIVELPGCPPNLCESMFNIQKYYGKSQTPNLFYYNNIIETFYEKSSKQKINLGE